MANDSTWLGELLGLLEAPTLLFSRAFVGQREYLIQSGVLGPADFEHSVLDERGEPAEVRFDERRGGLGYDDPYRGWTAVDQRDLQRFKPDLRRIFATILGDEFRPLPKGPQEIELDGVWELGSMQLTRLGQTDIWFARRLIDAAALDRLRRVLSQYPSERMQLALTSTIAKHRYKAVDVPARIISIDEVVSAREPDRIDLRRLKARFQNAQADDVNEVVYLSADRCVLTVHGGVIIRVKSDLHRDLLFWIVHQHEKKGVVVQRAVLERAGSGARGFDQAFGRKHWPALNRVFKYDRGDRVWRFQT
jgi:hypothetical protein